jgi:SHS2 domain-containing protein
MTEPKENTRLPPSWEHFPHSADMGVRGFGATPAEAFASAAVALTAIICDPAAVGPTTCVAIRCEAPDLELLLIDWLNAVIFEMSVRRMLFGRFEVRIEAGVLEACLYGEQVDRCRHQPAVEVKGATYTELKVGRIGDGRFIAQCVVDV